MRAFTYIPPASPAGRAYIRDALLGDPDGSNAGQWSAYAAEQISVVLARAADRGETAPEVETVIDGVVTPSPQLERGENR